MIRVNDVVSMQNARQMQCFVGKSYKGEMAVRQNRDKIEAIQHLNVAIDKLKSAVNRGDLEAENLLGKLFFHRVLGRNGVKC